MWKAIEDKDGEGEGKKLEKKETRAVGRWDERSAMGQLENQIVCCAQFYEVKPRIALALCTHVGP